MPFHLGGHLGCMCTIQLWIRMTSVTCATIDDFMTFGLRTCRALDVILGHIFRFRWDLWVFTYVAWSMIDDYMSPDFRPVVHLMPILGHIFRFRWDLWIFTYVAWSMIDDFMSPDFRPVVHPMPYWGIFPFWVRFTDLHRGHVLDDRWFHVAFSSYPSHIRCHTGGIFPFWVRFTDLHGGHVLDDRWFHVGRFLTCHTFDAILRHITVLDETCGSS